MKKIFITTAMASVLCMGFVSCADELNIKSIDPQSTPTYTVEGLLAKQYATLGLTGQKGPAGSADLSGDEGESGFIRTIFNLQELMTDETAWAYQADNAIAPITNFSWNSGNDRVNWAYQRLIFNITSVQPVYCRAIRQPERRPNRRSSLPPCTELLLFP